MKFTVLATALLAAFLPPAQADFDVFMVDSKRPGMATKTYQIWDRTQPNTCTSVFERREFLARSDVSGHKSGVRCKGACGYMGPTRDIEQLEMHFQKGNPTYHWTIYKDRNYGMYGLDGKKYGDCFVTTGNDYDCSRQVGPSNFRTWEVMKGYRKFHCKTKFTAAQILHL